MGLEGVDEEILQDFIVEAGEIIELLSEQLVELEKRPTDHELLNAIFRGFHTVKGGAGFLSLSELVKACHGAENVFDFSLGVKVMVVGSGSSSNPPIFRVSTLVVSVDRSSSTAAAYVARYDELKV